MKPFFIKYDGIYYKMPFQEFVYWLGSEAGRDDVANRHWISQYRLLYDGERQIPDFVGRIETLEADFALVCDEVGMPKLDLPWVHKSAAWQPEDKKTSGNEPDNYYRYYTEELAKVISGRYEKDIRVFDYTY